ncbi:hypothetical protein [Nonomuraea sp. KM90]|uniref:hypothetical protein n=1 Tax=Nonomuraea sp. KM90 TaxID=3457428 RepID=UPI003FCC2E1D
MVISSTPKHDKTLHFIAVSRDLSASQQLHLADAGDDAWSVKLTLSAAGPRLGFADLRPCRRWR